MHVSVHLTSLMYSVNFERKLLYFRKGNQYFLSEIRVETPFFRSPAAGQIYPMYYKFLSGKSTFLSQKHAETIFFARLRRTIRKYRYKMPM